MQEMFCWFDHLTVNIQGVLNGHPVVPVPCLDDCKTPKGDLVSPRRSVADPSIDPPSLIFASVSAESTAQTNGSRPLPPSSPVTTATVLRDRGTSPVRFPTYSQSEFSRERFQPIHEEVDDERWSHQAVTRVAPRFREQDPPPPRGSSTLDQLWEKFCSRWPLEDSQPPRNREASLLERLERLARLIQNTRGGEAPGSSRGPEDGARRRKEGEEDEAAGTQRSVTEPRRTEAGRVRWAEQPSEQASGSSPHRAPPHLHLRPADRDETDTVSTSGSVSTVDTARLARVFGPRRVQLLKTSRSLRKLYGTIDKQRGGSSEEPLAVTPEDSTVSAFLRQVAPQAPPGTTRPCGVLRFHVAVVFRCRPSPRCPLAATAPPHTRTSDPPGRPRRGRAWKWPTKASRRVSVRCLVWI